MVRLTQEEREDLTKEKSLGDAYALARKKLKGSPKYALLSVGAALVTSTLAVWSGSSVKALGDCVREWSSMGFQFAYGVVGILLAGFAIYTTVALSPLVPALAKARNPHSGESELKTLGLHFVEIFVPFIAFIVLHLVISALGWAGGPAYQVSVSLGSALGCADVPRWLAAAMMGLVLGTLTYLTSCLWVFVFNVYASFMMMARSSVTLSTELANGKQDEARDSAKSTDGETSSLEARKRIAEDAGPTSVKDEVEAEDDEQPSSRRQPEAHR